MIRIVNLLLVENLSLLSPWLRLSTNYSSKFQRYFYFGYFISSFKIYLRKTNRKTSRKIKVSEIRGDWSHFP